MARPATVNAMKTTSGPYSTITELMQNPLGDIVGRLLGLTKHHFHAVHYSIVQCRQVTTEDRMVYQESCNPLQWTGLSHQCKANCEHHPGR